MNVQLAVGIGFSAAGKCNLLDKLISMAEQGENMNKTDTAPEPNQDELILAQQRQIEKEVISF